MLQEYKKYDGKEFYLNILINKLLIDKFKLIKYSHIIFHEILSKYVSGKNIFIDEITNYENDSFLKIMKENLFLIDSKTQQYLEEIILEVFETKFNAYFMGYQYYNQTKNKEFGRNEIYEILTGKENYRRFINCIKLLEDQNGALNSERFIPNIFYSAYIKSYLYQFIYYLDYQFRNNKDNKIEENESDENKEKDEDENENENENEYQNEMIKIEQEHGQENNKCENFPNGNSYKEEEEAMEENEVVNEEEINSDIYKYNDKVLISEEKEQDDYEWLSFKIHIRNKGVNDKISKNEIFFDNFEPIMNIRDDIDYYIKKIINAIRGENNEDIKSRTRKVIEIYTFRLIYNFLNKNYNKFKKYDFKLLTYRSNFTDKESIEEENPKFIDFCRNTIEDFINIPDETPKEVIEEQNFYTHSLLCIRLVGRASLKAGIISQIDYKSTWHYLTEKLKFKKFNIDLKIEDIILSFDIIDELSNNLKIMLSQEKIFKIDLRENNFKHIGILIYALRLCFHSFTIDNGFKTNFYSRLLDPNGDLFSLLSSHYIPGSFRGEKGIDIINDYKNIKQNDNEFRANNVDKEFQIKPLTLAILKFLFNSHLLFATLLRKSEDEYYIYYSTFNPLYKIFDIWEKLYKLIPGTENNKVEIFLNRINKDIAKMYNKCQNLEEENNRTIFENIFDNYINECIRDYDYFKLIYYNSSIKAIIQEDNYPFIQII